MSVRIRCARPDEVGALGALLAPEVARGTVLPCAVRAEEFLVAEVGGVLRACVALRPWTEDVAELGSLVSAAPGLGLGSMLVLATIAWAEDRGYSEVVALTGTPDFFEGLGFRSVPATPHAAARGEAAAPTDARLGMGVVAKAQRCAACPRLAGCQQVLLRCEITPAVRRVA